MADQTIQRVISNSKTIPQLPEALSFDENDYFPVYNTTLGKVVKVKKSNIVFTGEVPTKLSDLDTPGLLGQAGKILIVNETENGYIHVPLAEVSGVTQAEFEAEVTRLEGLINASNSPVDGTYPDLASLIADQNSQLEDYIYEVLNTGEGEKGYYFYNGTTAGTIEDYTSLTSAEVAALTQQAIIDAGGLIGINKANGEPLPKVNGVVTLEEGGSIDESNLLHKTGDETKKGNFTIEGKANQNFTDKTDNFHRPVINDVNFYASPTTPVTAFTDFHGIDIYHGSGSNMNALSRIFPFEIHGNNAANTDLDRIVDFYALVQNAGSGTVNELVGIQLWNRNTGVGTVVKTIGTLVKNPINDGGGVIQNNYGIYIEDITGASTHNYGIYSLANNFFRKIEVESTDLVTNLNAQFIGGVSEDKVVRGSDATRSSYSSDLNNINKSGFYSTNNSTLNAPTTGYYGVYHTQILGTLSYASQIAVGFVGNDTSNRSIYFRNRDNGTWRSWKEISVDPPKEHQINGTRLPANVSGTYAIDWNAASVFDLTMTADTTFSFTNLPTGTNTKIITVYVEGNFIPQFPGYSTIEAGSDPYDGTVRNRFVFHCINGTPGSEDITYNNKNL